MLKVVVLGYGELAQALILGVLRSRHKLVGVMRWHKSFLKDIFMPDSMLSIIRANNIKEIKAEKANSERFIKEIKKLKPDVIIVGSWGEIIKKDIFDLPKVAFINTHPSFLPRHRGSNPYSSVLKEGELFSGVTFHLMDKKIDAGDILLQEKIPVSQDDTGGSLRSKCALRAKEMVRELLDKLEKGQIIPVKQKEKEASYYPPLNEEDLMIDWSKSAEAIGRQIRAICPFMKSYTRHKNDVLVVKSAEIIDIKSSFAKPGAILEKNAKGMIVSTVEKNKALFIENSNIEVYGFWNAKILSKLYIAFNLKTGDVFY